MSRSPPIRPRPMGGRAGKRLIPAGVKALRINIFPARRA